jgi:hypothetical protein
MVATVLAAGCLGYARLGSWLQARRHAPALLTAVWLLASAGFLAADLNLQVQFARVPRPISASEAVELWRLFDQVGPDEGVIAQYEMTAPLSSRQLLYSYGMTQHRPRDYQELAPEITWLFYRKEDFNPRLFRNQGFRVVHDGPHALVRNRDRRNSAPAVPASPSPARSLAPQALSWEDVLGNSYLVLSDVLRTSLFLAPGLALLLLSRRHPSLTALVPDGRTLRDTLRNALVFALMFGSSAGSLTMAAGVAFWSWSPLQFGAVVFSATMAVTLLLLYLLDRKATPLGDAAPTA